MTQQLGLFNDATSVQVAPAPLAWVMHEDLSIVGDPCPPAVLDLLSASEYDGNVLLEMPQVGRKVYEQFDEVLTRMRGKWQKTAPRGHHFPFDPRPLVQMVIASGRMPPKNPLALFATPEVVADKMIELAGPGYMQYHAVEVLEPSAGTGAIAKRLIERCPSVTIKCVEMDPWNVGLLRLAGLDVDHANFLKWQPPQKYDVVLMNPPFSGAGGNYKQHIKHALTMLKPDGDSRLVAIIPASVLWKSSDAAFMQWVADNGDIAEIFDNGEFEESGTPISTLAIYLSPNGGAWRYERMCGYPTRDIYHLFLYLDNDRDWDKCASSLAKQWNDGHYGTDVLGQPDAALRNEIERELRTHHARRLKEHELLGLRPADWSKAVDLVIRDLKERIAQGNF